MEPHLKKKDNLDWSLKRFFFCEDQKTREAAMQRYIDYHRTLIGASWS